MTSSPGGIAEVFQSFSRVWHFPGGLGIEVPGRGRLPVWLPFPLAGKSTYAFGVVSDAVLYSHQKPASSAFYVGVKITTLQSQTATVESPSFGDLPTTGFSGSPAYRPPWLDYPTLASCKLV